MNDRELMQMALNAMESFESGTNGLYKGEFAEECKALRDRLAEDMPVKILGPNLENILNAAGFYKKREWVGLTDKEIEKIALKCWFGGVNYGQEKFAKYILAELKDKNT